MSIEQEKICAKLLTVPIYVVAAVALQAQALVLDTIYDTKYNIDKE